jgi:type VII secretion protein EccB
MRSRRDQVQAHAYVVGRLISALVHGEQDAPETPLRRTTISSFGGLVLGGLGVAGFLVWGLISPGGKAGALPSGELIVAKQTGTSYIYAQRELRPVLNWSSALLLLGGKAQPQFVSAASLAGIPEGQPVGIAGAPDALPAASVVNKGDWLACAGPQGTGSAAGHPLASLAIGVQTATTPVPAGSAVIVASPAGLRYLLWQGHRLRMDAPWIQDALGLGGVPAIQVSPTWLNAVPAGPDLRPLGVQGIGGAGPTLGGLATRVGQVLVVHNMGSPSGFYLAEAGGVAPITVTQVALAITDPATAAAYRGTSAAEVPVSPAAIAAAPAARQPLADGAGAPPRPPTGFQPGGPGAPCIEYPGPGSPRLARLVFAVPPAAAPPALGTPGVSASPQTADLIKVVPDGGALVRPQSAPGTSGNSMFLVTDAGVKFPVPSASAATALGYRAGQAAALPAALVGLLPTGPALDLPALRGVSG